jgi:hypothetical protein
MLGFDPIAFRFALEKHGDVLEDADPEVVRDVLVLLIDQLATTGPVGAQVRTHVETINPTFNRTTSQPNEFITTVTSKVKTSSCRPEVQRFIGKSAAQPNGLYVVMLGEAHNSGTDRARANELARNIGVSPYIFDVVVTERGMNYEFASLNGATSTLAGEGEFCIKDMGQKQRSMVVAAYLVLCCLMGVRRIAVFFGENHKDIFQYFELFIRLCKSAQPLVSRPRIYQLFLAFKSVLNDDQQTHKITVGRAYKGKFVLKSRSEEGVPPPGPSLGIASLAGLRR